MIPTYDDLSPSAYGKAILVEQRKTREQYVIKVVDMRKMPAKEKIEARKECDLLREMRCAKYFRGVCVDPSMPACCDATPSRLPCG